MTNFQTSHGMMMDPEEQEQVQRSPVNPAGSSQMSQRHSPSNGRIASAEKHESVSPSFKGEAREAKSPLGGSAIFFIKDEKHASRKQINSSFRKVKDIKENSNLIPKDDPPFETALIVYQIPQLQGQNHTWDDHRIFLQELDKKFFLQPQSKMTWCLKILGGGIGSLAPPGMAPLVFYLGENLLTFIPVSGTASNAIYGIIVGSTALPCGRLLWERGAIIGNTLFDHNGLTPGENDQKPHIYKLTSAKGRVFAFANATLRALPIGLLFWVAEQYFPEYRASFLGPLALVYFEMAYRTSMEYLERLNYTLQNKEDFKVYSVKMILRDHLKKMHKLVNAKNSDKLVTTLYDLIHKELDKLQNDPKVEDGNIEHISAMSTLLIKHLKVNTFDQIKNELALKAEGSSRELSEVIQEVKVMPVQEMANTLKDIDNVHAPTKARSFLENLAIYVQGAGGPGRYAVTAWAVNQFLSYCGLGDVVSYWSGIGTAALPVVLRTMSEWYQQEEALLSVRGFVSQRNDYWGARWFTNLLSAAGGAFYTCAPWGIINTFFGDAPVPIQVLLCVAMTPSEFSSLFHTFREKYGNMIRGIAATFAKTPSQKRAWLNDKIDELDRFILKLDHTSTQQLYHLTQEAL